jgi:hypothetical protein
MSVVLELVHYYGPVQVSWLDEDGVSDMEIMMLGEWRRSIGDLGRRCTTPRRSRGEKA